MGIGMQGAGGFMEAASATNRNQMAQQAKYSKRDEATKLMIGIVVNAEPKPWEILYRMWHKKTSILGMLKLWI